MLVLEGAQAGLSWLTILRKREGYRRAFDGFDPEKVARYDARRIERLLADPGIVRNRLKIESAVRNARGVLALRETHGGLAAFLWGFVGGTPRQNRWGSLAEIPARTAESDAMSKALRVARLRLRRADGLLRVHAGRRHGQRPHDGLLPARRGGEARRAWRIE